MNALPTHTTTPTAAHVAAADPKLRTADARTASVIEFFETLELESMADLASVYTANAHFIDPFNDVKGHPAISQVFEHMFAQLEQPRFEVLEAITEGDRCFLLWNFYFSTKAKSQGTPETKVHGGSFLRYAPCGRVMLHHDHWDPARELYEGVPLLGTVLRWVRRRLQAKA